MKRRDIIIETLVNCTTAFYMQSSVTVLTNNMMDEVKYTLQNPEDAAVKGSCIFSVWQVDVQPVRSKDDAAITKAVYYSLTFLPYHLSVFIVKTTFYVGQFLVETFLNHIEFELRRLSTNLLCAELRCGAIDMYGDAEYNWKRLVYSFKRMMKKIGREALICSVNWMLESTSMLFSLLLNSSQDLSEWQYRCFWEQYYVF